MISKLQERFESSLETNAGISYVIIAAVF